MAATRKLKDGTIMYDKVYFKYMDMPHEGPGRTYWFNNSEQMDRFLEKRKAEIRFAIHYYNGLEVRRWNRRLQTMIHDGQ